MPLAFSQTAAHLPGWGAGGCQIWLAVRWPRTRLGWLFGLLADAVNSVASAEATFVHTKSRLADAILARGIELVGASFVGEQSWFCEGYRRGWVAE